MGRKGCGSVLQSTLCYLERGEEYLMLHRVKKAHDANRDKWIGIGGKFEDTEWPTEYMHLFTATGWTGEAHPCDEGDLAWIRKADLLALPMWEGDRIFLRLLDSNAPFFSLKLCYAGDRLESAVLNGKAMSL